MLLDSNMAGESRAAQGKGLMPVTEWHEIARALKVAFLRFAVFMFLFFAVVFTGAYINRHLLPPTTTANYWFLHKYERKH